MDAVGLASSIISFISVAHKVIRGSYEIYTSSTGSTEEHDHTARVVGDLQQLTAKLKARQNEHSDHELVELAGACYNLSVVLTKILEQFLPKGPGRLPAFVAACRTLQKRSEIISIEACLDRYRQQISQRLIFLLFEQRSPVKRELDDVRRDAFQLSNINARKIEQLETQLMQTLDSLQYMDEKKESNLRSQQEHAESLVKLNHKLESLQQLELERAQNCERKVEELILATEHLSSLTIHMPMENQVLRRLFFPSIFQRDNDIADPSANTLCWIFDAYQESDSLALETAAVSSLSQNRPNERKLRQSMSKSLMSFLHQSAGTILLTGKAGCGKSTFMKYIAHHSTTKTTLQDWAGNTKLVLVRVFFWRSDDAFQSSMVGFWRSVLFQILSQCPELVPKVFPQQQTDLKGVPDAVEFREPELELAFQRFIEHAKGKNYSFCCFIDGLDEHQGDNLSHKSMATLLSSWASQPSVKMICSSRPETVFIDIFRSTGTISEFHKLNFGDISNFAEHKFITSLSTAQMQIAQRHCLVLVHEIATRAEGVFLWASMAVRALINQALDHDDTERALRQRLQECPDSLEALFQQMLSKVDRAASVQRRSNMALYLAVHNPFKHPLNLLMYSWLDGLDWFQVNKSFQASCTWHLATETYTPENMCFQKEKVDSLLHQVTRGLLEVVSVPGEVTYFRYRVDLFHRSVRDFLKDQWKFQVRKSPFSDTLDEIRAYTCLRCLEIEGLVNQNLVLSPQPKEDDDNVRPKLTLNLMSIFESTFMWLAASSRSNQPLPTSCLEDFGTVLLRAEDRFYPFLLGLIRIDSQTSWRYHSRNALTACSYIHWAAYWNQGHFVRSLQTSKGLDIRYGQKPVDLNLLLSSSMAADPETTRYLLANNHSPTDMIQLRDHLLESGHVSERSELQLKEFAKAHGWSIALWEAMENQESNSLKTTASIWMVFLRDFASNVRSYCWKRRTSGTWPFHLDRAWLDRLAHVIEEYLKAGSDPEVFFLLSVGDSDKPFRVDLYQMLDIFKPDNLHTLGELLMRKRGWKSWVRGLWTSPSSDMYQDVPRDTLLNDDWGVLGVCSENGESLMGSFKVRVF